MATCDHNIKLSAMRRVDSLMPQKDWVNLFGVMSEAFSKTSKDAKDTEQEWAIRLERFLCRSAGSVLSRTQDGSEYRASEYSKILRSIQSAYSFSQRREFPIDSMSWERLLTTSNVISPYLQSLLDVGECNIEPLMAMHVEKSSGGIRLKALPCPEQLVVQQYLLEELLGASSRLPQEFESAIPAVRYYQGKTYTTGLELGDQRSTLCFSHQIDMEVIRGEKPPGEEGIFRPFRECWADFVGSISEPVRLGESNSFDDSTFHVARLDIRSYYDTLTRLAIDNNLFKPLREGLKSLGSPQDFAPSFRSSVLDLDERARAFIDELCSQSFGYSYFDPNTGIVQTYNDGTARGIPQGPGLSAYLGTIALFQLDRAVNSSIEGSQSIYARYVMT